MDDVMTGIIRENVAILVGGVADDLSVVAAKIESLEEDCNDSQRLYYSAGYLRACAELADVSLEEVLENL